MADTKLFNIKGTVKEYQSGTDTAITVSPIWKKEKRHDFLKTQNEKKEPKISMKWRTKKKK